MGPKKSSQEKAVFELQQQDGVLDQLRECKLLCLVTHASGFLPVNQSRSLRELLRWRINEFAPSCLSVWWRCTCRKGVGRYTHAPVYRTQFLNFLLLFELISASKTGDQCSFHCSSGASSWIGDGVWRAVLQSHGTLQHFFSNIRAHPNFWIHVAFKYIQHERVCWVATQFDSFVLRRSEWWRGLVM